jgi:hypothetical protein
MSLAAFKAAFCALSRDPQGYEKKSTPHYGFSVCWKTVWRSVLIRNSCRHIRAFSSKEMDFSVSPSIIGLNPKQHSSIHPINDVELGFVYLTFQLQEGVCFM